MRVWIGVVATSIALVIGDMFLTYGLIHSRVLPATIGALLVCAVPSWTVVWTVRWIQSNPRMTAKGAQ